MKKGANQFSNHESRRTAARPPGSRGPTGHQTIVDTQGHRPADRPMPLGIHPTEGRALKRRQSRNRFSWRPGGATAAFGTMADASRAAFRAREHSRPGSWGIGQAASAPGYVLAARWAAKTGGGVHRLLDGYDRRRGLLQKLICAAECSQKFRLAQPARARPAQDLPGELKTNFLKKN